MTNSPATPPRETIGTWRGVRLEVVAWDAVGAVADLSCAGMFARESGGAALAGGLRHLDQALGGGLLLLRDEGLFRGEVAETLLLDTPPAAIAGKALLMVGLGDPDRWTPAVMERATRAAATEAVRRAISSASFAPGMLDSGLEPAATAGSADAMLRGVTTAIDASHRLAAAGLATGPMLDIWAFGAGAAHLGDAARSFRTAFAALP